MDLAVDGGGEGGADIEPRSSVDRDAALLDGGFRHFSSDEEKLK